MRVIMLFVSLACYAKSLWLLITGTTDMPSSEAFHFLIVAIGISLLSRREPS